MTAESLDPPAMPRKLAAELLGTFVLVFFGVGAAMASGANITATALAFGISVLVMAYAVGHISGGHFNPAVSVGAAVAGRISWIEVAYYVVAQIIGAVLAALVLFAVWKGFDNWEAEGAMGQNSFGDDGSGLALWAALIIEIIGTAIFLWVILAATDKRNKGISTAAPVAIGLALTGLHLVMIPLTGTSVNPARSIGPALFAGTDALIQLWVFIVAPLIGAAIAGFSYMFIFGNDGMSVPGAGLNFGGAQQGASYGQPVWDPNSGQWVQPGLPAGVQQGGWAPQQPQQVNPGAAPGQQQPPYQGGPQGNPGQQQPPYQGGPPSSPGQQYPPQPPAGPPAGQQPPAGPPSGQQPPPQQGWNPPADPGGTQIRPSDGPA